jgi:transposase
MPDQLWALVEPLLPAPPRPPYGGRHRTISDRNCVAAIVFMARTLHPVAATARPRARLRFAGDLRAAPHRVGEGRRVRRLASRGPGPAGRAGPAGLVAGQCGHHERAGQAWGDQVGGANPVDRGKPGSKLHLVCDGGGLPLTAAVTAANVADTILFQAVLDDVPPIRTPSGRRRNRTGKVHADKAYDSGANRAYLRRRGIRPRIARRGVESSVRHWAPPLEDRAGVVVAELLQAPAGAVGPRRGTMVCVRAAGLCGCLLQPALTGHRGATTSCVNAPSRGALRPLATWAATDSARAA